MGRPDSLSPAALSRLIVLLSPFADHGPCVTTLRTPGMEQTLRKPVPAVAQEDLALREIVHRLVEAYEPERVYLFGSHARGEAGPDSDYDLLVIVPDSAPLHRQRSRLAYEVLWGTGTAADVLVWKHGTFEARLHLKASLPYTVLTEGRLLYAA